MQSPKLPQPATSVAVISLLFCGWFVFVLASALGVNWTGRAWDFAVTGQLGDSFGVVSALMTTLAAIFSFRALAHQRAENERLREREVLRDAAEHKREAEASFFRLLEVRRDILNDIVVDKDKKRGTDAFDSFMEAFSFNVRYGSRQSAYDHLYNHYMNDLGHYFRWTYHIIKFVVDRFQPEDRYGYVRLLRAQLSNSEQMLLALNCVCGEGCGQFKQWVEEFSLLHNMDEQDIEGLDLAMVFEESAFKSPAV